MIEPRIKKAFTGRQKPDRTWVGGVGTPTQAVGLWGQRTVEDNDPCRWTLGPTMDEVEGGITIWDAG